MDNLIDIRKMNRKEILNLFEKTEKERYRKTDKLDKKTLGMIFEKSSTRTRISFEEGMNQLGGNSIFLSKQDTQLGRGEPIKDTGRVLTRYLDGVMARLHGHEAMEELEKHSDVPVINGLTDKLHPCQALTDYYTIWRKKDLDANVVFLGDGGDNVCHSLINTATVLDKEITISCPSQHTPEVDGNYQVIEDPEKAVENADVIYTDVWVSMGEKGKKKKIFEPYQVNKELMSKPRSNSIFMHCLPAHRGEEVTDEVVESSRSVVFDQAENRLHLQKALLLELIE